MTLQLLNKTYILYSSTRAIIIKSDKENIRSHAIHRLIL